MKEFLCLSQVMETKKRYDRSFLLQTTDDVAQVFFQIVDLLDPITKGQGARKLVLDLGVLLLDGKSGEGDVRLGAGLVVSAVFDRRHGRRRCKTAGRRRGVGIVC